VSDTLTYPMDEFKNSLVVGVCCRVVLPPRLSSRKRRRFDSFVTGQNFPFVSVLLATLGLFPARPRLRRGRRGRAMIQVCADAYPRVSGGALRRLQEDIIMDADAVGATAPVALAALRIGPDSYRAD
jgi:hypothetical protein